jgi:heme exporter protein D
MSDATLRSRNNLVIWLAVAITLLPLVPYALRGTGA